VSRSDLRKLFRIGMGLSVVLVVVGAIERVWLLVGVAVLGIFSAWYAGRVIRRLPN
jgi:hypothetical protein